MSRLARTLLALAIGTAAALLPHEQAFARTAPSEVAGPPTSSDSVRLTLVEAVEAALSSYPSLGAARAGVSSAEATVERTASSRWPDLSVRASATRYEEPMIVRPIHGFEPGATPPFDRTLLEAGAYLDYTLYDFGARSARVRRARRRASAARSARVGTEQEIVAEVAATYLDALGLRGVVDAHDRRVAALEAERARVVRMREVGRAARVELLRVEAALASARSDREEVSAELEVAARELHRLTELPPARTRPRRLADPSPAEGRSPDRQRLVELAVERNPAVRQARRRREAVDAALDVARAARWPELKLGGGWVDRGSSEGDFRAEWSVGVGFSLPLFTGGRISGEVGRARAEATGAEQRVRLAEKAVARAVDRAYASLREKSARVESLRRAVDSQEEVVRIERLRLDAGTGTQTDYLDAEADLLSARASLDRTRYAALRVRVELARATGTLDARWIERNLERGR